MKLSERMAKGIMRGTAEDYMDVGEWAAEVTQLEETNDDLLEALEYIKNTLCDSSRNDFKNVNNALVRAGEAISKAKSRADTLKGE